ncbi:hypothetical protein TEA_028187 [Camellia sinensis var. sinensis]|uniref:Pentatricopeptide repeat-containing protein n=2 Tax=Camellia sinensis TaxID=4442 RepID=A0A4S4DEY9_CAMSN|nr:hypothetical protein TEA_028187 [Camellia sinensis var. sinensis]
MFVSMHSENTRIDCYAIPPLLKSCSSLLARDFGIQVHCLVIKHGLDDSSVFVQTGLIDFYAKTGNVGDAEKIFNGILVKDPVCYNCLISGYSKSGDVLMARKLFDEMADRRTLVSWNAMLSCYAHNGDFIEGFRVFERMQGENCRPNEFTVVTVLSICAKLGNLEMGLRVKKFIDDNDLRRNMIVSTALLEMYVKCGAVDEARWEFDQMDEKDVVAWSAMIAGYAQNGRSTEALELFECMKREEIKPNDVTLVSVLSACAQLGSVEAGERIGSYVESLNFDANVHLASALLAMYSKCGNIKKARQVFRKMPHKDVVSWNSMIMGLAINGFSEDAIALYEKMKETGVQPDDITFVGLLTACTHAGCVDLGFELFRRMRVEHGISPKIEHYACIVDLFCRSGRLKQAYQFICQMEVEPNSVIWGTLLGACRIHSNVELAELSINKLIELEPGNAGNYVLLSNMYASVGRWQEASKVRFLMKSKSLQKTAAYSWIELEDKVHKFLVGDTSNPRCKDVYRTIDGLAMHSTWSTHAFEPEIEFC